MIARLATAARWLLLMTHRWLGIAGLLLFVAWFLSGIVMIYVRMPELSREERLARAPALDLSAARFSPADAAARADIRADRVVVSMREGRPVYRLSRGRQQATVFADTGELAGAPDLDAARAAAARFVGAGQALRESRRLTEPDQWTLQDRARLPMQVFAADDGAGTEIYVSETTGEVTLRTTRRARVWAFLGPVIHWGYFTPLRRNGPLWSQAIIWSSVGGCVIAITGLLWGAMRFSPFKGFRVAGGAAMSPYTGLMKWHHYAGLLFGVFTFTWVYSGLLSMEPFGWFATTGFTPQMREATTGEPMEVERLTLDRLREAVDRFSDSFVPRELETMQFWGETYWAADALPDPGASGVAALSGLNPRAARPAIVRRYTNATFPSTPFVAFDRDQMRELARRAMPDVPVADESWIESYDGYYYDARGERSLPVLRARFRDANETWLYLDPKRAAIVDVNTKTSRVQRWLYHGLHSLDFPALYFRRPLWDAVMIALSLGGFASSATALLPAWRRLRSISKKNPS
jgi:hypothetical protein